MLVRQIPIAGLLVWIWGLSSPAWGNFSLNLGYHNPPGSDVGLNFLYFGQKWGFEFGVGAINLQSGENNSENDNSDKTGSRIRAAGDVNLKYFFGSGMFRPYIQGGVGVGINASTDDGASAGTGGGFFGGGLLLGNPGFYIYGSYNYSNDTFIQAGVGIGL